MTYLFTFRLEVDELQCIAANPALIQSAAASSDLFEPDLRQLNKEQGSCCGYSGTWVLDRSPVPRVWRTKMRSQNEVHKKGAFYE
jgi:hypothetical protein